MTSAFTIIQSSQLAVTNNPNETIITYSLGSCVGVVIYDPQARVGGMIHCMLPLSKTNPERAREKPAMFVDTGIPIFFKKAYALGAKKERLTIKVAGCSEMLEANDLFKIGRRNYVVLKKLLWKNNLLISTEHVGGSGARTLSLDMKTGTTYLKTMGEESVL